MVSVTLAQPNGRPREMAAKPGGPTEFVIEPINATNATNSQIERGLNNLDTTIKSIANKASTFSPAGSSFGSNPVATFIKFVQIEQGGSKEPLPTKKIEATQALQAAIAKKLFSRLLPPENSLQYPLFDSFEFGFEWWLETQRKFEGYDRLSDDRKRQWIAKYLAENIKGHQHEEQHQKLVKETTKDIEETIRQLYPDWNVPLREKIELLVENALDLTIKMMGKKLAISLHWVVPGAGFSEENMKMTDIGKSGGTVALCVFPAWKDLENFTIAKAKVYCL